MLTQCEMLHTKGFDRCTEQCSRIDAFRILTVCHTRRRHVGVSWWQTPERSAPGADADPLSWVGDIGEDHGGGDGVRAGEGQGEGV